MSGLAKWCRLNGFIVSGSDKTPSFQTDALKSFGIKVFPSHSAKNISGAEAVVYTSAVAEDNEELVAAKKLGLPVIKRSELLGYALRKYPRSVAVAGSHGKTTVTAMLWEIFEAACEKPAVFLGGEYGARGNFTAGGKPLKYAIAEACEYKSNFLDIKPSVCVILNVDNDHLESFGGAEAEREAFKKFAANGVSVINADDEGALYAASESSVTFGIKNSAVFTAKNLTAGKNGKGYSFTAYEYGVRLGRITLKVGGRHNVYNALAAVAVARISGISFCTVKKALFAFSGVKRRNEELGTFLEKKVFADYAHHPTEIKAFLQAKREENKRFAVVFQPHTYSRTRLLKSEFVSVLSAEPRIIIYKTYPARERYEKEGDAKTLYEELFKEKLKRFGGNGGGETDYKSDGESGGTNRSEIGGTKAGEIGNNSGGQSLPCKGCLKCSLPLYAETEEELINAIKLRISGAEEILFVGAGDIYEIALKLIKS